MKKPTKAEKEHMQRIAALPCCVCGSMPVELHHTGTYMGGGRNHMRILPLCFLHHRGSEGIDGKRMGKRVWEKKYGSEEFHLAQVEKLLTAID